MNSTLLSLLSNLGVVVCISDKVIPAGISYQDHLNKCPTENPMKCTFCLAQSESTFDVIKMPKLLVPNRFTCTFCNLELPSSDTIKSHLKEVHNVSNAEFVPVNINMTDIEKDRFLVCENKSLKRQKRVNDSSFYTEICKNMTVANNKRSKVVSEHDDSQLTSIKNTTDTSKQLVKRNPDDSLQQHKTMKRKYSNDSTNVSIYFFAKIFWIRKFVEIFLLTEVSAIKFM